MADLFTRTGEAAFNVTTGLLFGTTPGLDQTSDDMSRITVDKDGRVRVELKGVAKTGNGTLFQSVVVNQGDMLPVVTSIIPGPCVIDLTAVGDKVRAALKWPADQPLVLNTVRIDAGSPKDKLTVNGVEVDLDPEPDYYPED